MTANRFLAYFLVRTDWQACTFLCNRELPLLGRCHQFCKHPNTLCLNHQNELIGEIVGLIQFKFYVPKRVATFPCLFASAKCIGMDEITDILL